MGFIPERLIFKHRLFTKFEFNHNNELDKKLKDKDK